MKNKKPYSRSVYRALSLVTQFGISMLVPIGLMTAIGIWLDSRFGCRFMTVILFFLGAVSGGRNVYRLARGVYEPEKKAISTEEKASETKRFHENKDSKQEGGKQ